MRTWTKRDWTPVRRGKTFCSPACGGKCTKAAHDEAQRKAKELAARLGPGWRPRVWENLDWYWDVRYVFPDGELKVRDESRYKGPRYSAWLEAKGFQRIEHHNDPQKAVRRVVAKGHEHLQYIAGIVTSAHAVALQMTNNK